MRLGASSRPVGLPHGTYDPRVLPGDDDVPGPPLHDADDPFGERLRAVRPPRRRRRGRWPAVVAGLVGFVVPPVLAVLGFLAVLDPSMPSQARLDALVADAPAGTTVVSEDATCGSGECARWVRLAPPPAQTVVDVLDAMDVSGGSEECGVTSWWNWQRTCVGARTDGGMTEIRVDPAAATVRVYITQRAVGD